MKFFASRTGSTTLCVLHIDIDVPLPSAKCRRHGPTICMRYFYDADVPMCRCPPPIGAPLQPAALTAAPTDRRCPHRNPHRSPRNRQLLLVRLPHCWLVPSHKGRFSAPSGQWAVRSGWGARYALLGHVKKMKMAPAVAVTGGRPHQPSKKQNKRLSTEH
jgi:hypothetical protein